MSASSGSVRECPRFAVIPIHSRDDVQKLVGLMMSNGYTISFVNDLQEMAGFKNEENPQIESVGQSPPTSTKENPTASSSCSSSSSQTREKEQTEMTVRQAVQARMRLGQDGSSAPTSLRESDGARSRSPSLVEVKSQTDDDVKILDSIERTCSSNTTSTLVPLGSPHYNNSLRGSGSNKTDSPSSNYVICRLCNNKIMSSRLSNLTNHVRRHAANKQFACPYCNYQHNEQSKVRLHMLHNHGDNSGKFVDNLTPEMQKTWSMLMKKCFPNYEDNMKAQDLDNALKLCREEEVSRQHREYSYSSNESIEGDGHPRATSINGRQNISIIKGIPVSPPQQKRSRKERFFDCKYCNAAVSITFVGAIPEKADFSSHIRLYHESECITHQCGECGYVNAEEWKVRLHISVRHAQNAADVSVKQANRGTYVHLHINKCFPSAPEMAIDHEEEQLFRDVGGEKGSEKTAAKIQAAVECREIKQEENTWEELRDTKEDYIILDESLIASSLHPNSSNSPADHRSVAVLPPIQGIEVGENNIICSLCGKVLDYANKSTLCGLMAHAKRHHYIKQYECPHCQYSSSEAAHVRSHLLIKHNSSEKPLDLNSEAMQQAWLQVAIRCFPDIHDKIEQFRFKTGKALVIEVPEDEPMDGSPAHSDGVPSMKSASVERRTPPVHHYGTRRSTARRH